MLNTPLFAMSIIDFARAHSISRSTVYEEISAGRIPVLKVGRRTLITTAAAANWRQQLERIGVSKEAAQQ